MAMQSTKIIIIIMKFKVVQGSLITIFVHQAYIKDILFSSWTRKKEKIISKTWRKLSDKLICEAEQLSYEQRVKNTCMSM